MKTGIIVAIGITVGIVISSIGTIAIINYRNKSKKNAMSKKIKKLYDEHIEVDCFDSEYLSNYVELNKNRIKNDSSLICMMPTEENLTGIGYIKDDVFENSIVFCIFDSKNKTVQDVKLVKYTNIDSNLEAKFIEENGMVVIEE